MTQQAKRVTYAAVCDWDNLRLAHRKAAKGKRGKRAAAAFEYRLADNLLRLQHVLVTQTYQPGPYNSFYIQVPIHYVSGIKNPKRRLISAAPFRDRVVHHALCNLMEPVFERGFIYDSYANRVGKGTHRALDRAQYYARRFGYVLQCDVEQFFPAVDHRVLKAVLARKVRDQAVLWLIDQVLDSGVGVLAEEYRQRYFPGDDLFAAHRPRGLPIGNLTSQFWANCLLDSLDHFVKRDLECRGYLRYVDDFALFADDKEVLWTWREALIEHLAGLRLTIHPGAHPRPVAEGFPFLGFVVYPTHRRLKRRKVVAYRRKLDRLVAGWITGKQTQEAIVASLLGWFNHARYGDTWGLRSDVLRHVPAFTHSHTRSIH